MTRKEFIEKSLLMGIGLPFMSGALFSTCGKHTSIYPKFKTRFSGKVIIVGAGAAGLAAGFLLKRYGVDFQIIEAAPVYGGRIKKSSDFADFPIDLGAEWIHTNPKILAEIINTPNAQLPIETIVYNPKTIKTWKNGKLKSHNYTSSIFSEWKFKNSTWFDFFEQFIVPEISDNIILNKPIAEINYHGNDVRLVTKDNELFNANKILITAPVKTLQNEQITFQPLLPADKREAISKIYVGDGIKIFIKFKEKFYPDMLAFGNIFRAISNEEKFVYDAAFKKDSGTHVLGLFAINNKAKAYTQLNSEQEILNKFLAELDEIFDGKASTNYLNHIIQNWSKEPYIQGAYSYSFDGSQRKCVATLSESIVNKIYFAGEALSLENQATVHGACESAYRTVAKMMKDE